MVYWNKRVSLKYQNRDTMKTLNELIVILLPFFLTMWVIAVLPWVISMMRFRTISYNEVQRSCAEKWDILLIILIR